MNPIEKLIELVRPHQCLYYTKDKDYKNTLKKEILWEKISKALNQSRDETQKKWKNLKDGYTKHKKEVKGTTGQKRKYLNWPWAPYLSFLDCTIEIRPTASNILTPAVNPSSSQSNEDLMDLTSSLDMPIPPAETPLPRPESPRTSFPETPPAPLLETLPTPPPITIQTPSTTPAASKKIKPPDDDIEKVITYLKNKKKTDAVDMLFNSYAESFKKLKPRIQAKLKLKLAQIFTEAELEDLDSENHSVVSILSPSYSLISTTTCDDDQDSVLVSDAPLQTIAEDLTVPTSINAYFVVEDPESID